MATVVRVKRRLEENPVDALVLHCKRAKTELHSDAAVAVPSLFVFSGTLDEQDNESVNIRKDLLKNKNRNEINNTKDIPSLIKRMKEDKDSAYHSNRLKIINYSRGISLTSKNEDESDTVQNADYSLLDIYNNVNENENKTDDQKYAYDLYFSHKNDVLIDDLFDIEGIHPLNGELVFNNYRSNGNVSDSDDDEDEDSNCENNWRNEYPDTENDDNDSVDEDNMCRIVQNLDIGNDLSTDDDEELVYGYTRNDSNAIKINKDDVEKFGLAYAKYKSKVLSETNEDGDQMPSLIDYDDSKAKNGASSDEDDGFYYPKHDYDDDDDDGRGAESSGDD